jgi:hypothetical protein
MLHRQPRGELIVELQPETAESEGQAPLPTALADAIRRISSAPSSLALGHEVVSCVRALRALVAERQATSTLVAIQRGAEPMILADGLGDVMVVNDAFHRLLERPMSPIRRLDDLLRLAADETAMRQITDVSAESSTGALLRELEAATRRAADLTAQLLSSVAREVPPDPEPSLGALHPMP